MNKITRKENINADQKKLRILLEYKPQPSIASAGVMLRVIKRRGYLDDYLKETNYEIFEWSLKHDSLRLIQALTNLISKRRASWMITNDDYSAIRDYVSNILQLNTYSYKTIISIKYPILKEIICIKFNHATNPVYDLIKEIIECNKEKEVATVFLQDIEKIVTELKVEKNYQIESSLVTSAENSEKRKRPVITDKSEVIEDCSQVSSASCISSQGLLPNTRPKKRVRFNERENEKEHIINNIQQPVV